MQLWPLGPLNKLQKPRILQPFLNSSLSTDTCCLPAPAQSTALFFPPPPKTKKKTNADKVIISHAL